ncbi:protein of unknown function [Pseudomonas mediterranea]
MPGVSCGVRARQIADGFAGNYRSQNAGASLKLLGYRYREQARSHPDLGLVTTSGDGPIHCGSEPARDGGSTFKHPCKTAAPARLRSSRVLCRGLHNINQHHRQAGQIPT